MGIAAEKRGTVTVIQLGEEFAHLSESLLPNLQAQVQTIVDSAEPRLIVLDMKHVGYFTSSFITFLLQQHSEAEKNPDAKFALATMTGYAFEILSVSRLTDVFKIFKDVDEAVANLS
ncbi:MAG: STAS domain-containing protein [Planctomycetota bacterium]|nr:STAS domain-containing protein [Planctomycetota bacterium]